MFTSKYRWMAAFGTSIACHVVVFVVIGVVVALFPSCLLYTSEADDEL